MVDFEPGTTRVFRSNAGLFNRRVKSDFLTLNQKFKGRVSGKGNRVEVYRVPIEPTIASL